MDASIKKLDKILSKCNTSVLYKQLNGEIDCMTVPLPKNLFKETITLPNTKDTEPFSWADTCKDFSKNKKTCVFIPGSKFDIYGTRFGMGGGWYDRFLSKVPRDWLRIGVAYKDQLSLSQLPKESWDESVDWLVIQDDSIWKIYETHARTKHR